LSVTKFVRVWLYDIAPDVTGTLMIDGAAMGVPIVDPGGQNGVDVHGVGRPSK
jgi:hypothetical protein